MVENWINYPIIKQFAKSTQKLIKRTVSLGIQKNKKKYQTKRYRVKENCLHKLTAQGPQKILHASNVNKVYLLKFIGAFLCLQNLQKEIGMKHKTNKMLSLLEVIQTK